MSDQRADLPPPPPPAGPTPPPLPDVAPVAGGGRRPVGANARLAALVAAFVALGLFGSVSAVVVVLCLVVMIFLHELGHYLTARWAGMKVTEFFIGFGPKIWSFQRGETEYGIKAIPAGAYVRIIGMTNLEEVPPEDEGRTYRQAPYWRRMSVAVAGSTMHFLLALVLMFALLAGYGRSGDTWEVGSLSRLTTGASPAQEAGLQLGDRIVAVDGRPVPDWDDLTSYVRARPGQEVTLTVARDGRTVETTTRLAGRNPASGEEVGFLGVSPTYPLVRESIWDAARHSVSGVGEVFTASIDGLGRLFSPGGLSGYADNVLGRTPDASPGGEVTGTSSDNRPLSVVGVVRIGAQAADAGMPELLSLLVLVNVFIGVFNLVPLLPLDGGHVAVATYERIRSRRGRRHFADVNKLLPLTYGVVAVLGVLFISSAYLDIANPIANPFQR